MPEQPSGELGSEAVSLLRHEYAGRSVQELLTQPTSALLGVSDAAAALLRDTFGLATVFDLGSAYVFAIARAAATAAEAGHVPAHAGLTPADWLRAGVVYPELVAIGDLPLADLRAIADTRVDAQNLARTLDVATIRDFAYWPPRVAAERIVQEAVGATLFGDSLPSGAAGSVDDSGAEELRPRFGQFPTERVYYSTFAMLHMPPRANLTDLQGAISLGALADAALPDRPAIAAVLTFSQSWYAQGITLGHLLHCLALAPGEATRVALIDWSRRALGSTEEQVSQAESLDNATEHGRAVSEVQAAVADELQQGGSTATGFATSASQASAQTSSSGLLGAIFGGGSGSDTQQAAQSFGIANSTSWSLGNRSVLGSMAQNVNDRTEQHATSVRNRRASAVSEVSESEHAQASTRIVANYNHMHALTIQYYEVVQIYRTVTQLHRAERVLVIPLALPKFDTHVVDRFKGNLQRAALNDRVREILDDLRGTVAVSPRSATPIADFVRGTVGGVPLGQLARRTATTRVGRLLDAVLPAPDATATATTTTAGNWSRADFVGAAKAVARPLVQDGSDALHLPPDVAVTAISVDGADLQSLLLERSGADPIALQPGQPGTFKVPAGTTLGDIDAISLQRRGEADTPFALVLQGNYQGQPFSVPLVTDVKAGAGVTRAVALYRDAGDRQSELLAHLDANRDYYTAIIARALGPAEILRLVSGYSWNGRPLADQIEPRAIGVVGHQLLLRAPVEASDASGVLDGTGKSLSWGDLLAERGVSTGQRDERLVPIPTSGVFAEAVLGRSNSAEKLDLTRFWNWQDSPIPLAPTEILPVDTGSRGQSAAPVPGQLAPSVANIVNPTALPDPTGINAVLNAVANGNIFRDMSGLAGTQQIVQAGQRGTLQAATEAGQLAAANLKTEAQKQVALGQIIGDIAKSALGGGAGGGKGGAGISGEGARINQGRDMDSRGVGRASGATSGGGARPASGNVAQPARSTGATPGAPASPATSITNTPASLPLALTAPPARSYEVTYADAGALGFSPEATADAVSSDGAGSNALAGSAPTDGSASTDGSAPSSTGGGPIAELAAAIRAAGGDENALSAVLADLSGDDTMAAPLDGLSDYDDLGVTDSELDQFNDDLELP